MLARILHSETAAIIPWLVASAVIECIAIAVIWFSAKNGEDNMGVTAIALTGLLISPVSWHAVWVWIVPISIFTALFRLLQSEHIPLGLCCSIV